MIKELPDFNAGHDKGYLKIMNGKMGLNF